MPKIGESSLAVGDEAMSDNSRAREPFLPVPLFARENRVDLPGLDGDAANVAARGVKPYTQRKLPQKRMQAPVKLFVGTIKV